MTISANPFFLFEMAFPSGTIRGTDSDLTVVYSGNTFPPRPLQVEGFGKSSINFMDTMQIEFHNVDRAFSAIVLNDAVHGSAFRVFRSEWVDAGSYSNPVVVFEGQFDSCTVKEGKNSADVSFDIRNDFVRWDLSVPRHSFAGTCQWVFKSTTPGCQYTGAASLCNKTWERCESLGNTHRFRGCRWIPLLRDKEVVWGRGTNPPRVNKDIPGAY